MKVFISLSLVTTSLLAAFAFSQLQQSKLLTQQNDDYERQNFQLLTQVENSTLKKLEAAKALRSLQSELGNRDSQLAALSRQLETAQQQINPDYQQIETRIRQQLTREIQASNKPLNPDPRIAVLNQLSQLDPVVMGEIMALNAQYGEFIKGLDVSEERKGIVINALHNLIGDQNQARSEIIQEMQADPQAVTRGNLRQQMRAISEPSSQLEALAYDLTETELDAFAEFQEQRQNTSVSFGRIEGTSGSISPFGGAAFFEGNLIQSGSEQSPGVQILLTNPDDYRPFFSPTSSSNSARDTRD